MMVTCKFSIASTNKRCAHDVGFHKTLIVQVLLSELYHCCTHCEERIEQTSTGTQRRTKKKKMLFRITDTADMGQSQNLIGLHTCVLERGLESRDTKQTNKISGEIANSGSLIVVCFILFLWNFLGAQCYSYCK